MDVATIVILIVAAWLGFYVLTVLMSQHHKELMDAWEAEQAARAQQQQQDGAPPAAPDKPDGRASPTSAWPSGTAAPATNRSRT